MPNPTPHTSTEAGGPAFPQLELVAGERDGHGDAIEAFTVATGGMSLRDWFAGQAAASIIGGLVSSRITTEAEHAATVAKAAYSLADALLAARKAGAA